jgi:hypothetical protein
VVGYWYFTTTITEKYFAALNHIYLNFPPLPIFLRLKKWRIAYARSDVHLYIFTFRFILYYILLPSSFLCHETMNTDDTPLIVVTSHNMTSQYKSTPRRTVNCFVTSCWKHQCSSVNSYTPIGLSNKIMI